MRLRANPNRERLTRDIPFGTLPAGWSRVGWVRYLRGMADACRGYHMARAVELEKWADEVLRTASLALVAFAVLLAGCVASSRQPVMSGPGAVLDQTTAATVLRAPIAAEIEKLLEADVALDHDESARQAPVQQTGGVNVNRTDQSSSDKWVNRALAVAVSLLLLTYPVGKLLWLIGARFSPAQRMIRAALAKTHAR